MTREEQYIYFITAGFGGLLIGMAFGYLAGWKDSERSKG
jgi:hypothetical protein